MYPHPDEGHIGKKNSKKQNQKNLKFCGIKHDQLLDVLAQFRQKMTSEKFSTRKKKLNHISRFCALFSELMDHIHVFMLRVPRMWFIDEIWKNLIHLIIFYVVKFQTFWMVLSVVCQKKLGCSTPGSNHTFQFFELIDT